VKWCCLFLSLSLFSVIHAQEAFITDQDQSVFVSYNHINEEILCFKCSSILWSIDGEQVSAYKKDTEIFYSSSKGESSKCLGVFQKKSGEIYFSDESDIWFVFRKTSYQDFEVVCNGQFGLINTFYFSQIGKSYYLSEKNSLNSKVFKLSAILLAFDWL
tara:strand:- start:31 stop:507 length:477 start_codon:yes stop_codon:yes gene_type:complete